MLLLRSMAAVRQYVRINAKMAPALRQFPLFLQTRYFSSEDSQNTDSVTQRYPNLTTLVDGCDYEHWLVVMEPPQGYPSRDQIVRDYYVKTLALAFRSEDEAKKSMYSVSTKYYYSFSCKIPEILVHKIRALPNVEWVLPDSFLPPKENYYAGEPFVDGKVVPYDEKYHADWLREENNEECRKKPFSRRAWRRQKKKSIEKAAGLDLSYSENS